MTQAIKIQNICLNQNIQRNCVVKYGKLCKTEFHLEVTQSLI